MSAERVMPLSSPLLVWRGRDEGKRLYLGKIIEITGCLLVELTEWKNDGSNRCYRRLLKKFIREGGLECFDCANDHDRQVLAEAWDSIYQLGYEDEEDLSLLDDAASEKDGTDEVIKPPIPGPTTVQDLLVPPGMADASRGQEQSSQRAH